MTLLNQNSDKNVHNLLDLHDRLHSYTNGKKFGAKMDISLQERDKMLAIAMEIKEEIATTVKNSNNSSSSSINSEQSGGSCADEGTEQPRPWKNEVSNRLW